MADDAEQAGKIQGRSDTEAGESVSMKQTLDAKEAALKEINHKYNGLELEFSVALDAAGTVESDMHDFEERVCIGYTLLFLVQPGDAQSRGVCLGGYLAMIIEDAHSLHLGGSNSHEKRRVLPSDPIEMVMFSKSLRDLVHSCTFLRLFVNLSLIIPICLCDEFRF